jgi:hypothetical protein
MNTRISTGEAYEIIGRWASERLRVVFAMEFLNCACSIQRSGLMDHMRPGVFIHRSGDASATVQAAKFGEIVFLDDPDYQGLRFRERAGISGCEVVLIADVNGDLTADSLLLLSQMVTG